MKWGLVKQILEAKCGWDEVLSCNEKVELM